jgi:hypothetical protein
MGFRFMWRGERGVGLVWFGLFGVCIGEVVGFFCYCLAAWMELWLGIQLIDTS